MSDKRLKILLAIIIIPFLVWGLFTLLTKQESKTEEILEKQEEVAVEEPDIEIIDLEGPKQKYINKTFGFSFEFPDELEYDNDNSTWNYESRDYFLLKEQECLKEFKSDVCKIYPNGFEMVLKVNPNYQSNCYIGLNKEAHLNLELYGALNKNVKFQIFENKKINNIETKEAQIYEYLEKDDGFDYGYYTKLRTLFCVNSNMMVGFTLEDSYVKNDMNINGVKNKYNLSYEYFQEIISSMQILVKE